MLDKHFIETVKQRISLSEWIGRDLKLIRRSAFEFAGLCPFHPEKTPSFTVNDAKGFYHCFGCGAHGDIFHYVSERRRMPFVEVAREFAEFLGLSPAFMQEQTPADHGLMQTLWNLLEEACHWFQRQFEQSTTAQEYCQYRGFSKATCAHFQVGFAPQTGASGSLKSYLLKKGFSSTELQNAGIFTQDGRDRFFERLMFPIRNDQGKVVAFGGRTLSNAPNMAKYLNSSESPVFHKKLILFGYHEAQKNVSKTEPFVVVEGYCDVMTLYQAGLKTAVAPLGTALTVDHLKKIWSRNHIPPILCFDGDLAGKKGAHRIAKNIMPFLEPEKTLCVSWLPSGEDPDNLVRMSGLDVFKAHLHKKIPLVDVIWDALLEDISILNPHAMIPEEKALLQKTISQYVSVIGDKDVQRFYREHLLGKFYQTYRVNKRSPQQTNKNGMSRPLLSSARTLEEAEQILLITLKNHPNLIQEVSDDLMHWDLRSLWLRPLYEALLSYTHDNLIEDWLSGISHVLGGLQEDALRHKAPFIQATSSSEDALKGWKDVWQRMAWLSDMQVHLVETAKAAKENLDESSWNRLKSLKIQVCPEKSGT